MTELPQAWPDERRCNCIVTENLCENDSSCSSESPLAQRRGTGILANRPFKIGQENRCGSRRLAVKPSGFSGRTTGWSRAGCPATAPGRCKPLLIQHHGRTKRCQGIAELSRTARRDVEDLSRHPHAARRRGEADAKPGLIHFSLCDAESCCGYAAFCAQAFVVLFHSF